MEAMEHGVAVVVVNIVDGGDCLQRRLMELSPIDLQDPASTSQRWGLQLPSLLSTNRLP